MKYHYMVVEGPHDAAAVGKILEVLGARQVKKLPILEALDSEGYITELARLKFPFNNDLTERMPVPLFFRLNDPHEPQLIVVHAVGGESKLVSTMVATLNSLDDNGEAFSSLSMVGDADNRPPSEALNFYRERLAAISPPLNLMQHFANFPSTGLVLERGRHRIGVFVLPDNINSGTLETILLDCTSTSYSEMRAKAEEYVDYFVPTYGRDWSIFKRNKAVVGCMNNLLYPGMSNTVAIANSDWLCDATMTLPGASKLQYFLKQLLGMEPCSPEPVV